MVFFPFLVSIGMVVIALHWQKGALNSQTRKPGTYLTQVLYCEWDHSFRTSHPQHMADEQHLPTAANPSSLSPSPSSPHLPVSQPTNCPTDMGYLPVGSTHCLAATACLCSSWNGRRGRRRGECAGSEGRNSTWEIDNLDNFIRNSVSPSLSLKEKKRRREERHGDMAEYAALLSACVLTKQKMDMGGRE